MMNSAIRHDPNASAMFGQGTKLGETYGKLFPGQNIPQYQPPKTVQPFGDVYRQAAGQLGLSTPDKMAPAPMPAGGTINPSANNAIEAKTAHPNWGAAFWGPQMSAPAKTSSSPKAFVKGGGTMSAVPTGMPPASPTPQTSGNLGLMGTGMKFSTPQTSAISALNIPQQQYGLAQQQATQQIGQQSKMAQQDLMRQYAARGLGRSGLEMQGAANLYNQGAGQQAANSANQIQQQNLAQQFGAQQQAQQLESQRQLGQGQLQLQSQGQGLQGLLGMGQLGLGQQAQNLSSIMQPKQYGLQQALGLGQLGLGEQQMGMQQIAQQNQQSDFMSPILANLGSGMIGAGAAQGGKK